VVGQAAATIRLREASLQLTEAQRMPSVSLTSTYSRIAYPENAVAPTFNRSNWSIGASVTVPLLTGGRQKGDELVARAELDESKLQHLQAQELAALDTRAAWAELLAARATWEFERGDRATGGPRLRDCHRSLQRGRVDAARALRRASPATAADANRAQAARNLQVARAHVALLPDLPLGSGSGVAGPASSASPQAPQTPSQPAPSGSGQFRTASAQGTQVGTR